MEYDTIRIYHKYHISYILIRRIFLIEKNKDKHMDRNGKKIIDFCKMSDMKILNGRIGKR